MCPTLELTREDFRRPFSHFVADVFAKDPGLAMFKVRPPKEWSPRLDAEVGKLPGWLEDMEISTPIQQNAFGSRGTYRCVLIEGKTMKVKEFRDAATKDDHQPPKKGHEGDEMLERAFWSSITINPPLYGADNPMSLFDKKMRVGWNLRDLGDLLQSPGMKSIPGVTSPMVYFGMWKSFFCWHVEDCDLFSINYLHHGAAKVWYCISPNDRAKFEAMAAKEFPELYGDCKGFMRHKDVMFSPSMLRTHNVPYVQAKQEPGEFMVLNSAAYHAGFNMGFNCAEAINFACPEWIPIGRKAVPCTCQAMKDAVSIDMRFFIPDLTESESESEAEFSSSDEEEEEEEVKVVKVVKPPPKKKAKPAAKKAETTPAKKKIGRPKGTTKEVLEARKKVAAAAEAKSKARAKARAKAQEEKRSKQPPQKQQTPQPKKEQKPQPQQQPGADGVLKRPRGRPRKDGRPAGSVPGTAAALKKEQQQRRQQQQQQQLGVRAGSGVVKTTAGKRVTAVPPTPSGRSSRSSAAAATNGASAQQQQQQQQQQQVPTPRQGRGTLAAAKASGKRALRSTVPVLPEPASRLPDAPRRTKRQATSDMQQPQQPQQQLQQPQEGAAPAPAAAAAAAAAPSPQLVAIVGEGSKGPSDRFFYICKEVPDEAARGLKGWRPADAGEVNLLWFKEDKTDGLFRPTGEVLTQRRDSLVKVRSQHIEGSDAYKLLTLRSRILDTQLLD